MTYSFSGAPVSLRPAVKISLRLKMGFITREIQHAIEVKGLSLYVYTTTFQWLSNWGPFITYASFAALLLTELELGQLSEEDGSAPKGPIVAWGKGGEERELLRYSMHQCAYRDSVRRTPFIPFALQFAFYLLAPFPTFDYWPHSKLSQGLHAPSLRLESHSVNIPCCSNHLWYVL